MNEKKKSHVSYRLTITRDIKWQLSKFFDNFFKTRTDKPIFLWILNNKWQLMELLTSTDFDSCQNRYSWRLLVKFWCFSVLRGSERLAGKLGSEKKKCSSIWPKLVGKWTFFISPLSTVNGTIILYHTLVAAMFIPWCRLLVCLVSSFSPIWHLPPPYARCQTLMAVLHDTDSRTIF